MDTENFDKLYHSDKPFSFGSKQTVLENINSTKEEISQNLSKMTFTQDISNIKNPENIPQFMFISQGNFFRLI